MPAQSPPLAECRSFPVDEIKTFRRKGGRLQGHSVLGKPGGVANSAGAPGMGLSFGEASGWACVGAVSKQGC